MTKVRALCIGGSWAGAYKHFEVGRDAHRSVRVQKREGVVMPTPDGETLADAQTLHDTYELQFVRHADGGEDWFAIVDGNTMEWALNQLIHAYRVHVS